MRTLILGSASSGKSAFAEDLAVRRQTDRRVYLATMHTHGPEDERRVQRHRVLRAGKGFATIERYTDLGGVPLPRGCCCLVECMSNVLANEMYDPDGAKERAVEKMLADLDRLAGRAAQLIVVSNEIFSDGAEYDDFCTRYIDHLGAVNRALAASSDEVIEVVAGMPLYWKGGASCGC